MSFETGATIIGDLWNLLNISKCVGGSTHAYGTVSTGRLIYEAKSRDIDDFVSWWTAHRPVELELVHGVIEGMRAHPNSFKAVAGPTVDYGYNKCVIADTAVHFHPRGGAQNRVLLLDGGTIDISYASVLGATHRCVVVVDNYPNAEPSGSGPRAFGKLWLPKDSRIVSAQTGWSWKSGVDFPADCWYTPAE